MPHTSYRHEKLYGYCILRHDFSPGGKPHRLTPMRVRQLVGHYVPHDESTADVLRCAREQFDCTTSDVFGVQCRHLEMGVFCSQIGMVNLGGNRIFYRPRTHDDYAKNDQWQFTSAVADMTLEGPIEHHAR